MSPETRTSAVRKLRDLADRLEAGEDVGPVFWTAEGDGYRGGLTAAKAQEVAAGVLQSWSEVADTDGWFDPDSVEACAWGVMVTVRAARIVHRQEAPACEGPNERVDYGLVDPDGYTLPELQPPDCDCEVCEPEEDET